MHFFKAFYVGVIGITLFKLLIPATARSGVGKSAIFLFVLSLGVLSSALWEIYEFLGDLTFTHTMQRGGNKDTMYDLLCGLGGSLVIAFYTLYRKQLV